MVEKLSTFLIEHEGAVSGQLLAFVLSKVLPKVVKSIADWPQLEETVMRICE